MTFFCNSLRRQHIDITKLILGLTEVLHLQVSLVDQRIEAVIEATDAYTQFFSDLALGHIRIVLQHAQNPKVGVLFKLRSAACHLIV